MKPMKSLRTVLRLTLMLVFLLGHPLAAQLGTESIVTAPVPVATSFFGSAAATDGSLLVVGIPTDATPGFSAGAAEVYRLTDGAWTHDQTLFSDAPAPNDRFGSAVAVEGDLIAVGAPFDDTTGNDDGAVFVFRWLGGVWIQEDKLISTMISDGELGTSVDIGVAVPSDSPSGEVVFDVIAGAPNAGFDQGAVALWELSPDGTVWNELAAFVDSEPTSRGRFGEAVSMRGDRIVVGAPFDDLNGTNSGSAYLLRRQGAINAWSEEAVLQPSDTATGDRFGTAVDIDGPLVVVGSPFDDDLGGSSGSVYVYEGIGANPPEQKITAGDGANGDNFGGAVAIDRDRIVVGAVNDDDQGQSTGAVYTTRRDPSLLWPVPAKTLASDASANARFGHAVSARSGITVVSANQADLPGANNAGAVYIFARVVFTDSFESGNFSAWSATVGAP